MNSVIVGNTTATPMTVPDFAQTDERKADFIKNKKTSYLENDCDFVSVTYVKNYVDTQLGVIENGSY